MAGQPLLGQGLILQASRSPSDTPHSVGLIGTSVHQPYAETSDNTQHSRQTSMLSAGFEREIPASERPANPPP